MNFKGVDVFNIEELLSEDEKKSKLVLILIKWAGSARGESGKNWCWSPYHSQPDA